ncbi:ATP-dependent 6-phosphofructokinase [Camellia lanceoleosa]|uniref:ATP-dependent 6-phosphofructokinase n=1 Tax=Camellia lanceoleosa TaxID=1840588 RepID=A0ACC0HXQ5_9ERIC|nr:ATP-dependent 6-phosphofructokinase [Camellia lanceoleosa]
MPKSSNLFKKFFKPTKSKKVPKFRSALNQLLSTLGARSPSDESRKAKTSPRRPSTGEEGANPESALDFLAKHCQWVVVTLGPNGCIAKHGKEAIDATGAEDLFASGFLYGLVKGLNLEECCKVGLCNGGSVIRALGGEVTPQNWQWMHKQM